MNNVNKLTPFTDGKKRKMVMTKLVAVAITARGANPNADVTFFKSKGASTSVDKHGDLADLLTGATNGHEHGINVEIYDNELYINVSYATSAGEDRGHYHLLARDSDGSYVISLNEGHTHTIDSALIGSKLMGIINKGEMANTISAEQAELLTAVKIDGNADDLEDTQMSKELEASLAAANLKLEKQTAELANANTVASFTPVAKAYYDTLTDSDKESFVGKTDADRVATMEMAKSDDPVVYKCADGTELHKSDGSLLLSMAKKVDVQALDLAKEQAVAKHTVFVKRAGDEMNNMAGTDAAKIALLKAADSIVDEEISKEVATLIKAANSKGATALEEHGHQDAEVLKEAGDKLDAMVKTYATENEVSVSNAYVKVLDTKAGQDLYNEANSQ